MFQIGLTIFVLSSLLVVISTIFANYIKKVIFKDVIKKISEYKKAKGHLPASINTVPDIKYPNLKLEYEVIQNGYKLVIYFSPTDKEERIITS